MSKPVIRDLEDGALQEQRALFDLSFPENLGSSVATLEHYRWKFHSAFASPMAVQEIVFRETETSEMLGYYAALPYQYKCRDGAILQAAMVCDVMTHPAARGKGVFTKLGASATEMMKQRKFDFTIGYPVRPEVIPGHLKVGWFIGFREPMIVKLISPPRSLPLPLQWILWILVWASRLWDFGISLLTRLFSRVRVEVVSLNDFLRLNEYEAFLTEWESSVKVSLDKSKKFMAWRFSAPAIEYQFFLARQDGRLTGIAIGRKAVLKGIETYAIMDFMSVGGLAAHLGLQHAIIRQARSFRCALCASMMSMHRFLSYRFAFSGFIPSPVKFSIIFKDLSSKLSLDVFRDVKNWHLFWIDSDDL